MKIFNFFDLTLNLRSGQYYPYRKPSDHPLYVNRSSNHPLSILKNLPTTISRRLTEISSKEEVFSDATPLYNNVLKASGYDEDVVYDNAWKTQPPRKRKRTRTRNITWFNPPFSKNVKSNIAQRFLRLVEKHFLRGSKLHKIFNRNTVKVSYSCTPNVDTIIKRHYTHIYNNARTKPHEQPRRCNCENLTSAR